MSEFIEAWANEPFLGIRSYLIRRRTTDDLAELYRVQVEEHGDPVFAGGSHRRIVVQAPTLVAAVKEAERRMSAGEWVLG